MHETSRKDLAACDLSCPVCGGVKTLQKRVNDVHNEIWTCTDCPVVLYPEQLTRLSALLNPSETPSQKPDMRPIIAATEALGLYESDFDS